MVVSKFIFGVDKILCFVPLPAFLKKAYLIKLLEHTGDWAGYEILIKFLKEKELTRLPGDFIEIGSFVGGGTAKLARFAKKFGKKVYAIDVFDVYADKTKCARNVTMSDLYLQYLRRIGMSQWQAYYYLTRGLSNVVTMRSDSMKVRFSPDKRLMFGFIDGNHAPEFVMNDFYLVWRNLTSRGVVAFDDYGDDLPQVTKTVDFLISKHQNEIENIVKIPQKRIIFIMKK
jgi:SAM-dependent methyltransferase